jgi:hypothetical protein
MNLASEKLNMPIPHPLSLKGLAKANMHSKLQTILIVAKKIFASKLVYVIKNAEFNADSKFVKNGSKKCCENVTV